MTAIVTPRAVVSSPPTPPKRPGAGGVLLTGIRWETYDALLHDLQSRRIYLTYDRGQMEIMPPLVRHERYTGVLSQLVEALARAGKRLYVNLGSATFRRKDLKRGVEPDRCFYIANAAAAVGKLDIDLKTDPPPDLAIEMDVTSSSLDRLGIYAALGFPEVWRFDGEELQILVRRDTTGYDRAAASPTFPALPVGKVLALLDEVVALDGASQDRKIRAWVRKHASGPKGKGGQRPKKL